MKSKEVVIICVCIIVAACIVGASIYFSFNHEEDSYNATVNNTTNVTNQTNITENTSDESSLSSSSQSSSDEYVYSPQSDKYVKKSGEYVSDGRGNTIYQWQGSDGVIYENYYDSNVNQISSEEYYK